MELPVTLIVKAPNQQIDDQTIQCELSWTINKLKQHLSEVYPSKPPKHEQKLIYSGKLLNDTVILKDILRQYDGQVTHTVHLVCTPKFSPKATKTASTTTSAAATPAPAAEQTRSEDAQRDTAGTSADQRVPNMQWYNQFNNMPNMPTADPQMMQMLMMQQAFMQAYYTQYQYMNMNFQHNYTNQPAVADQPQAGEGGGVAGVHQQPPQPVAANVNNAAQNLQRAGDNPEMNRDWLDVFYMLSRTMIFISIVYFYSSPIRCLVVVALAVTLYLYQIGFFRNVNINNNNIVGGDAAQQQQQQQREQQQPGQAPQEAQAPTRLMVLWTFFTTFFASLLPDIPNVV